VLNVFGGSGADAANASAIDAASNAYEPGGGQLG
jgi:hypothetical protein